MSLDEFMRVGLPVLISQQIRDLYHRKLTVGDRLPPERVLAEKFEVSLPTLREALALLARDGWIERKHGSGNYIAQPKRDGGHIAILMEMDFSANALSSAVIAVAVKVKRRLEERGRSVRLYFGDRTPHDTEHRMLCREFLQDVQAGRLSSVLVLAGLVSDDWMKPLAQQGVPVIGANSLFDVNMTFNRERWINDSVAYLKGQGKRRIGLVYWAGNRPLNPGMPSYGEIFEKALKREGMVFDSTIIRSDLHPSLDGSGWEEFREIWLRDPAKRPDGLIITDEMLLESGLRAAADHRLVLPNDLLISALTSDFQKGRDWDRIARFEWAVDQRVELCLKALDRDSFNEPATVEIPLTLRTPRVDAFRPPSGLPQPTT
jgi:DNA-binding transcriptional regulator YhcF (GntR family)